MEILYHVIHLQESRDRLENILKNEQKLGEKIEIFSAVKGSNVISNPWNIEPQLVKNFNGNPGELGCYLSHLTLIRSLIGKEGYTVIFEDDFKILVPDLGEKIRKNIENISGNFDIIFLGSLDKVQGIRICGDIHHIPKNSNLWGTHAYIINNQKSSLIYKSLLNYTDAFDNKLKKLLDNNILNCYLTIPYYVSQSSKIEFKSTIHN